MTSNMSNGYYYNASAPYHHRQQQSSHLQYSSYDSISGGQQSSFNGPVQQHQGWPTPPPSLSYDRTDNSQICARSDDTSGLDALATASMEARSYSSSPPSSPTESATQSSRRGPLKKRRKVDEYVTQHEKDAVAKKSITSKTIMRRNSSQGSCVLEAAAFSSYETTSPPSSPVDGNEQNRKQHKFPSTLHMLLSSPKGDAHGGELGDDSEVASAMEWLPSGKGFRVLRYEVLCGILRRKMPWLLLTEPDRDTADGTAGRGQDSEQLNMQEEIPGECNEARDDKNNDQTMADNSTSRDVTDKKEVDYPDEKWLEAFLLQISSWGFREVTQSVGIDRGSFCHEFFVRDSPELCQKMSSTNKDNPKTSSVAETHYATSFDANFTPGAVIPSTPASAGTNLSAPDGIASWRSSNRSSIFKPRGTYSNQQYPTHLHVPMLPASSASFGAEMQHYSLGTPQDYAHGAGNQGTPHYHNQQQQQSHMNQPHFPPPPPPAYHQGHMRSPKTIRFLDDVAVEITPDSEASPLMGRSPGSQRGRVPPLLPRSAIKRGGGAGSSGGGAISRRGRRPALIARHSTH